MREPDLTGDQPVGTPADEPRPSIGLGTQVAILVGALPVLVVLNNLTERLVTDVVGLSPWFMAVAFAVLTAVAVRQSDRVGNGEAGTLWFAALLSWAFAGVGALGQATGFTDTHIVSGALAGLLAARWLNAERCRRQSVLALDLDRPA
jgi:hypothetical protein